MDGLNQTLLDYAVKSNNLEALKLALSEGLNIHMKDKNGMTPLQILVQQRLNILSLEQDMCKDRQMQLDDNEKLINLLLQNDLTDDNCVDETGLSSFHVSCTMNDISAAERLSKVVNDIDQQVNKDSSLWPGYTALHFAASSTNLQTVLILVQKSADLQIPDAKGITPLQICIESFSIIDLHTILSCISSWKGILFSDGKTKLLDYIHTLQDSNHHYEFLQNNKKLLKSSLPSDSPLWPNYTILHLTVTLLPESSIEMFTIIFLNYSNIIFQQDNSGSTALHLAFRRNKMIFVKQLMLYHSFYYLHKVKYMVDKDNLSNLHIAIAMRDLAAAKKLLEIGANVNLVYSGAPLPMVKPGWTPLHIAVSSAIHSELPDRLLQKGADLLQTDAQGFTAIHLLLGAEYIEMIAQILLAAKQLKECVVKSVGLTHLHVAAWMNNPEAIERLLDEGSDIEARIVNVIEDEQLKRFASCKPIHLAMMNNCFRAFTVLLQRGADILTKAPDGSNLFAKILTDECYQRYLSSVVDSLWNNVKLQKQIVQEMGMTMLHIACHAVDTIKVQRLLERNVDVNARIPEHSSIWPGFTPLHLLIMVGLKLGSSKTSLQKEVDTLINLLLSKRADVSIPNADGDTPVHLAVQTTNSVFGIKRAAFLLKHQTDFSINPLNKAGISHFHLACIVKNVGAVKEFLKYPSLIDVNQVVSPTGDSIFSGQTPLLMVLSDCGRQECVAKLQVHLVNLLLVRGANMHAVDAFGYTPLHKIVACSYERETLMYEILNDNVDVNKRAKDGKTPMEILLSNGGSSDEVEHLIMWGGRINSYNPISDVGYMSIVYNRSNCKVHILKMMMDSDDIAEVDESGRNAIHNAVTNQGMELILEKNYLELFEKLIELGCNIHQRDNLGRTGLHLAFKFHNAEAVSALLMYGVDINETDTTGISAPFYALHEFGKEWWLKRSGFYDFLSSFLKKCQLLGIKMSLENEKLTYTFREKYIDLISQLYFDDGAFNRQVEEMKSLKIGQRGLTAYDFLCETRVYSSLLPRESEALSLLVETFDKKKFNEIWNLMIMQCRKALDRSNLLGAVASSFNSLLKFPLPDLCMDIVLKFLSNSDLRNLNVAMIRNDDVEMGDL